MKQRRKSGETLVETLAAILVFTLASLLFVQMAVTAARINQSARAQDAAYTQQLEAAERQTGDGTGGTVEIRGGSGSWSYAVTVYGGEAGDICSYAPQVTP